MKGKHTCRYIITHTHHMYGTAHKTVNTPTRPWLVLHNNSFHYTDLSDECHGTLPIAWIMQSKYVSSLPIDAVPGQRLLSPYGVSGASMHQWTALALMHANISWPVPKSYRYTEHFYNSNSTCFISYRRPAHRTS